MTKHRIEPYGGYAVSHVREAGGEETRRFDAFLTLHGRKIAYVSNGGTGGSHRYQPVTDDYAAFRAAVDAFERYAASWNRDGEFAGIEDADQLVNRLIEVAALGRGRTVMSLLDDEDFWETGVAHAFRANVTLEQATSHLSGPEYLGRNPRVWSRQAGDFVAVSQVTTERIYREVR